MSIFEWFGECFNPGPVGYIDAGKRSLLSKPLKRFWAIFFILVGLVLLYFLCWLTVSAGNTLLAWSVLVLYFIISYFLTPVPDNENLGWAGGLINDPFRISDNMNRFLVIFYLFLLPGKLVVFAFQTLYQLIKYNF